MGARRAMKRPPASVLLLLLLLILLIPVLHHPLYTLIRTPTPSIPIPTPATTAPISPVCSFITPPSTTWSYNSRSFCTFPNLCIAPTHLVLPSTTPSCRYLTAGYVPHAPSRECQLYQLERVSCAYTPGMLSGTPTCEQPQILEHHHDHDFDPSMDNVLVVPHYPFPANIYHFANVQTTLLHHLRLTTAPISALVFLASPNRNAWQAAFHDQILSAVRALKPGISIVHRPPASAATGAFCARNVTLLGRRGHTNVWPFPNTTAVTGAGDELPTESLFFRHIFYDAYSIPHRLPVPSAARGPLVIPHPPLVLGYARRLGPGAATGGNVHAIGTARRFSHQDEAWFQAMLEEETTAHGVRLHVFTTSANDPLSAQVTNFAALGAVIGIHGANLVNSMFMPPLGVLIEVFPADVTSLCYFAGGNAGLRYVRFESDDPASPAESGCTKGRCLILKRQRLVKISREVERDRLRNSVKEGLTYLTGLRTRFPDGVPVIEDKIAGMHKVAY